MGNALQAFDQLIPQSRYISHILIHMGNGVFHGCRHAYDRGQVFCAGTLAALLGAAFDQVPQTNTGSGIEYADSPRAVELVSG